MLSFLIIGKLIQRKNFNKCSRNDCKLRSRWCKDSWKWINYNLIIIGFKEKVKWKENWTLETDFGK